MRSSDPTCGPLRPRLMREIDRAVVLLGLDQATAETSTANHAERSISRSYAGHRDLQRGA
jgi:hypothetical protein